MRIVNKLLNILITIILSTSLIGCNTKAPKTSDTNIKETELSGTLSVVVDDAYVATLKRVIQRVQIANHSFTVNFVDRDGDITLTNRLPSDTASLLALDTFVAKRSNLFVSELLVKECEDNAEKVVGIPLFLNSDNYWYDELYYQIHSTEIPYSLTSFQEKRTNAEYGAVLSEKEMLTLFWSTIAPYYLQAGGTSESLERGNFDTSTLTTAMEQTLALKKQGIISVVKNAEQLFRSVKPMFYISSFENVSKIRNDMSVNSTVKPTPIIIFDQLEDCTTVLRSTFITVEDNENSDLSLAFLEELYNNANLVDMIKYSHIPLACRVSYDNNSIPQLVSNFNFAIAVPSLNLEFITCRWDDAFTINLSETLLDFVNEDVSIEDAVRKITK